MNADLAPIQYGPATSPSFLPVFTSTFKCLHDKQLPQKNEKPEAQKL